MKKMFFVGSLGLALGAGQVAKADFVTSFASTDSGDFNEYTQIASIGGTTSSPNSTSYSAFNTELTLSAKYGPASAAEAILNTSGPNGNGIYGNTYSSLTFKYYSAGTVNPATIAVGMATRLNSDGTTTTADGTVGSASATNTYPDYRVQLVGSGTIGPASETLSILEDANYGDTSTIATFATALTLSATDTYTLQFNAVTTPSDPGSNTVTANHSSANDTGVNLEAILTDVSSGTILADLTGTDLNNYPGKNANDTADPSDISGDGYDNHLTGYIGFYAGQTTNVNNSTFTGITATNFSVTSLAPTPEPCVAGLVFLSGSGLLLKRRRRAV